MQAGALIGDDWTFGTLSDDAGPVPWGAPEPSGSDCGCKGEGGACCGCGSGEEPWEQAGAAAGEWGAADALGPIWDAGSFRAGLRHELHDRIRGLAKGAGAPAGGAPEGAASSTECAEVASHPCCNCGPITPGPGGPHAGGPGPPGPHDRGSGTPHGRSGQPPAPWAAHAGASAWEPRGCGGRDHPGGCCRGWFLRGTMS